MGWQKFGLGMITTCTNNHSIEASWKTLYVLLLSGPAIATERFETLPGVDLKKGFAHQKKALRYPQIVRELLQNEELGYRPFCSGWVWIREFFGRKGTISLDQNRRKMKETSLILSCELLIFF